jgi:hypothetical protein
MKEMGSKGLFSATFSLYFCYGQKADSPTAIALGIERYVQSENKNFLSLD